MLPLFFECFLLSATTRCFRSIWYLPCPNPVISSLFKEPWVLFVGSSIWSQAKGAGYAHCSWAFIAPRISQRLDIPKSKNSLQNKWLVVFKSVKVTEVERILKNCSGLRVTKEMWHLLARHDSEQILFTRGCFEAMSRAWVGSSM